MNRAQKQNATGGPDNTSQSTSHSTVKLLAQKHDDELISRQETAAWLGVCAHTVQRNQSLKPLRFNRRLVRYRVGDVRAFIEAAAVK